MVVCRFACLVICQFTRWLCIRSLARLLDCLKGWLFICSSVCPVVWLCACLIVRLNVHLLVLTIAISYRNKYYHFADTLVCLDGEWYSIAVPFLWHSPVDSMLIVRTDGTSGRGTSEYERFQRRGVGNARDDPPVDRPQRLVQCEVSQTIVRGNWPASVRLVKHQTPDRDIYIYIYNKIVIVKSIETRPTCSNY